MLRILGDFSYPYTVEWRSYIYYSYVSRLVKFRLFILYRKCIENIYKKQYWIFYRFSIHFLYKMDFDRKSQISKISTVTNTTFQRTTNPKFDLGMAILFIDDV